MLIPLFVLTRSVEFYGLPIRAVANHIKESTNSNIRKSTVTFICYSRLYSRVEASKMEKFNVVQAWIDNVAYSHSKSENTGVEYQRLLRNFCDFIGKTPQQILDDYEDMRDRDYRRKYAQYVRALVSKMQNEGYAPNSIKNQVSVVQSFFKYNDLPLGHVPIGRKKIVYHNRDITKEEIQTILEVSRPRDKAFFCMMAQSGLRPDTLCSLRIKHIEPEFSKGIIPCKIEVPEELAKGEFGAYFTFMGEESVKYLKAYLATRPNIGPEDYLFASHGTDKRTNPKSVSSLFMRSIEKLKAKGIMEFEQKQKNKPRTVRLYNLRKYFRKEAGKAGIEYVNFWMGHKTDYQASHIPSSDVHYFSREDVEFQRQLYAEKAMPHLRLETRTPDEREVEIVELRKQLEERDKKMETLEEKLKNMEDHMKNVDIWYGVIENLKKQNVTDEGQKELIEFVDFVRSPQGKAIMYNYYEAYKAFRKEKDQKNP
jgi:integrase